MPKTIVEKILSKSSGKDLKAGDYAFADIDLAMANDITAPLAVEGFQQIADKVWDPNKIYIPLDHQAPADSINAAENHKKLREFAREQGIKLYDVGEGVCHQLMLENHVEPGQLVIGADSHTCTYGAVGAFATGVGSTDMAAAFATGKLWFKVPQTIKINLTGQTKQNVSAKDIILKLCKKIEADGALYKALEITGPTTKNLTIPSRATLTNMAIEMGAKTAIIQPDKKTEEYTGVEAPEWLYSDPDADYVQEIELDVSSLEPQIAVPHQVDNVHDITEVEGTKIDQVFIGSCTNGRLEDLEAAAKVVKGRSFSEDVRVIVVPASRDVYNKAEEKGFLKTLFEAGAVVEAPCCGPCMGGSFGLLAGGEVGLATSNRNFRGREGSPDAEVYLSSPEVAAESGIQGKIAKPRGDF
ncbi:Homoaconitate hydratase/3-isopropylmalate dehydratase large subunit LeuC family protein [Methanonatronarchaeum thermophilum]|uniref:3-isopropylmalate dehydratase large subunit n=1 Tax=Methanonatronarchaeum thermophilum TaxID=1927129 RepID=A0A1Y3GFY5_9EURY|nr:3-isopropylmalate dehydratase large subunit [Methanonatronarchaeum thermophilum]OUJ18375.1 Homoaconitate hydratase/3-isopropylmalate dehydratase large subunit LeuC family protein [Methanonatronarchaeum thermophilum]